MKHIKEYNNRLEDLEDYLQEVFDKFEIKKEETSVLSHPCYTLETNDYPNYLFSRINIDNIDLYDVPPLVDMIYKLKPNIEKRLKTLLMVDEYEDLQGSCSLTITIMT